MKVLNEDVGNGKPGKTFVLIMDQREAKTLVEIVETAHKQNKKRSTFRTWHKKIEECMACYGF